MEDRLLLKKIKVDLENIEKAIDLIAYSSRVDRMSSLPWEVLDNILCRLPIDVVAKMSVLSRRWKNVWKCISSIILDGIRTPRTVYQVLLSHHANIEKFILSKLKENIQKEDFICWLNFLRRNGNGIKEISLELHAPITNLSEINGFTKLVTLTLSNFTTDAAVLESVIEGCPLLENLKLSGFHIWQCIHVHAHMLKSLHVDGKFKDLCIESNLHLTDVLFNLKVSSDSYEARQQGVADHLVEFLDHQSQIKKLRLCGFVYKIWDTKCKSKRKVIAGENVSVLGLFDVWTNDVDQMSAVAGLLQNFPNLTEFSINLPFNHSDGSTHLPTIHLVDSNLCLNQLKFVKIETNYDNGSPFVWKIGRSLGRGLIAAIMKSSPVLKQMIVKGFSFDVSYMRELLSTPRASKDLIFNIYA